MQPELPAAFTDEERESILSRLVKNGKLLSWPGKPIKRKAIVLSYAASLFSPGHNYTEKEVTEILKTFYEPDPFLIRRELIEFGLMSREKNGSRYWLTERGAV